MVDFVTHTHRGREAAVTVTRRRLCLCLAARARLHSSTRQLSSWEASSAGAADATLGSRESSRIPGGGTRPTPRRQRRLGFPRPGASRHVIGRSRAVNHRRSAGKGKAVAVGPGLPTTTHAPVCWCHPSACARRAAPTATRPARRGCVRVAGRERVTVRRWTDGWSSVEAEAATPLPPPRMGSARRSVNGACGQRRPATGGCRLAGRSLVLISFPIPLAVTTRTLRSTGRSQLDWRPEQLSMSRTERLCLLRHPPAGSRISRGTDGQCSHPPTISFLSLRIIIMELGMART